MKSFAILLVAICAIGFMASESQAQHRGHAYRGGHHGYRHYGYHGNRGYGGGGFAIAVGSPYSSFGYSSFRPVYGGGFYPVGPVGPVYGGGYYGGGFYGGGCRHGFNRGGGAIRIGW